MGKIASFTPVGAVGGLLGKSKIGDVLMGSTRQKGVAQLLTPEQQEFLSTMLGGQQLQAGHGALMGLLQPQGMQQSRQAYQKAVVSPALQTLERDIIPAIQERYAGMGAGSSSALNLALSRTAEDLTKQLSDQFGQYYAGEQQRQMQGQLGGLGMLGQLTGQRAFDPIIQQKQGILGPLLGAAGKMAGAGI